MAAHRAQAPRSKFAAERRPAVFNAARFGRAAEQSSSGKSVRPCSVELVSLYPELARGWLRQRVQPGLDNSPADILLSFGSLGAQAVRGLVEWRMEHDSMTAWSQFFALGAVKWLRRARDLDERRER